MKSLVASLRSRRVLLGIGTLVLIVLAGFSIASATGDKPTPTGAAPNSVSNTKQNPTTTSPPARFPLTGQLANGNDAAARPAVVVKIDNAPEARPQYGVDKADVILEERVEGGHTRFMAVFQSASADEVGPVRSLRSSDVYALAPMGGGIMVYSGGIDPFKNMLGQANLADYSEDAKPSLFHRKSGRPFVHSLTTSTTRIFSAVPEGTRAAPKPLFAFVEDEAAFTPAGVTSASSLRTAISPQVSAEWRFDAGSSQWKRVTNGRNHDFVGGQAATTNVIIMNVDYRRTPYKDVAKNPVDEAVLIGSGDAVIASGNHVARVRWSRPDLASPTTFTDASGNPVRLLPGRTWMTFAPTGAAVAIAP